MMELSSYLATEVNGSSMGGQALALGAKRHLRHFGIIILHHIRVDRVRFNCLHPRLAMRCFRHRGQHLYVIPDFFHFPLSVHFSHQLYGFDLVGFDLLAFEEVEFSLIFFPG